MGIKVTDKKPVVVLFIMTALDMLFRIFIGLIAILFVLERTILLPRIVEFILMMGMIAFIAGPFIRIMYMTK